MPATNIISVGPTAFQDSTTGASVAHSALTPAGDNEAVCIVVCKRDAHTTSDASKTGFTELFTVTKPSGVGGAGTLACVYQVQTAATAIAGGDANSVSLPGESGVGTSIILSFKRGAANPLWAEHEAQSWKTPLPGTYINGMQVYEGMAESDHWLYFTGRTLSDYTSNTSTTAPGDIFTSRKVAIGTCRAAAAFQNPTHPNGGVTVIDLGSGCPQVDGAYGPTGNYKHWTGAWSAGPLVYRGLKFQPTGNRQMYDNFVVMLGDGASGPSWFNRDCITTGGNNGDYSFHFFHNLFLFAGSDEVLENYRAASDHCVLYSIIGPALQATSHLHEELKHPMTGAYLPNEHGLGMFVRGRRQHTHRNVFWGCSGRNPRTSVDRQSIVNNFFFNYWRNSWSAIGTGVIELSSETDPIHGNAARHYNVVGNFHLRGRMTGNNQDASHRAIRGNAVAGSSVHVDLNHTYGFTTPASQQAFLWDNTSLYTSTLNGGDAWSGAWGASKETVRDFGSGIGLTQQEALDAIDVFAASCGARPGTPDRFSLETTFFDYARNAVLLSGTQMAIYNSVEGTSPNDKAAWEANFETYRMLPNLGGWPSISFTSNWQGSVDSTLTFLGIDLDPATRNTAYTDGTFSDGRTSRVGYTQFQVQHIERKWAVGNPKVT